MNFMYFLAILIGPLMKVLYSFIGNYAVTIIVATSRNPRLRCRYSSP